MFKDELGGKIMKVFVGIRAKTWAYLIDGYEDDNDKEKIKNKKAKGIKKCVIKCRLMMKTIDIVFQR